MLGIPRILKGVTGMKPAEALALRADSRRRLEQLRGRITGNARHQEGTEPAEDAAALLAEADEVLDELEALIGASTAPTRPRTSRSVEDAREIGPAGLGVETDRHQAHQIVDP
jgi:hypothetical protein